MAYSLIPIKHVCCTFFTIATSTCPDEILPFVCATFLGGDQVINRQVFRGSTIAASLGYVELQLLIISDISQVHGLFNQPFIESRPDDEMDFTVLLVFSCHRCMSHR